MLIPDNVSQAVDSAIKDHMSAQMDFDDNTKLKDNLIGHSAGLLNVLMSIEEALPVNLREGDIKENDLQTVGNLKKYVASKI